MGFLEKFAERMYDPKNIEKMEERVRAADRNLERQMGRVEKKYNSMSSEQQRRCNDRYNECKSEYERRREAIDKGYETIYKAKNR